MSATLVAKGLAARQGDQALFSNLDLAVAPGDVVGVVGANGAGKSTLLRLLAGEQRPDEGVVRLSPPTATVGYLPQELTRQLRADEASTGPSPGARGPSEARLRADEASTWHGETVAGYVGRRTGVTRAQGLLDHAAEALAAGEPGAEEQYPVAFERWLALGGADLAERTGEMAAELGLSVELDRPMAALSGGQAARAAMAALLLSRYDVFLLDEPTNNLDLAGLERLEQFITGLRAATVLVSHDREFLTRTVTRVLELDLAQQRVSHFGGGYASYVEEREVARQHARESYEEYAETKADLEARARKQRAWMEKGVRNALRKAPDNDKLGKRFRAESSEKQAAKASQTDRLIERLEAVEEPRKEWRLRMEIAAAPRAGAVVATLRAAVVRRGEFTLGPVDLQIDWADRVAIVGANGSGKSTLLAALLGRVGLDDGHRSLGPGVVVGEIDQARAQFHGPEPLLDAFRTAVPDLLPADVRTLLAKFGLRAGHVLRPAATLSPGERTRAGLALLQARGVNLLVLDEPTNHLDLPAIEQLESALDSYAGTLLLVTHDRRMLAAVRTTRMIMLHEGNCAEVVVPAAEHR